MLCTHKSGFLLILALCSFERISSSPQRNLRQNALDSIATLHSAANQTSATTRQLARLTESYLPAVMQAMAYHIELLQYEPVHSTTIEPPFSGPSTTPPTFPNFPAAGLSPSHPPAQQPVTWWSPPSTTTSKPTTWWSPPSTTTSKPITWWSPPSTTTQKSTTTSWWSTTTQKPSYSWSYPTTTTQKPTTTSWWNTQSTTQKPAYQWDSTASSWWNPPSTTRKPLYSWSYPTQSPPTSSWFTTTTQKPTTTSWWNTLSTTTKTPLYSWSFPTQTPPTTAKPWNPSAVASDWTSSTGSTTTRRPSSTTPSWWHQETTPIHKPGYFAPDLSNDFTNRPVSNHPISNGNNNHGSWKPLQPQVGDLSFLSISNLPYFSHFVQPNSKSFVRKPEYEYLHQYPAELLQDIENEPYKPQKGSDQDVVNEFRRVYDDFFARVRVFSPITGKKRIPPTRPYVLFLIFYDLCKREAKRLNLQEFTGYSETMLAKLHETSKYSAERQLYTLLDELQKSNTITAQDFNTRLTEIMTDLANPNTVTSKALHILPPLKFEL